MHERQSTSYVAGRERPGHRAIGAGAGVVVTGELRGNSGITYGVPGIMLPGWDDNHCRGETSAFPLTSTYHECRRNFALDEGSRAHEEMVA